MERPLSPYFVYVNLESEILELRPASVSNRVVGVNVRKTPQAAVILGVWENCIIGEGIANCGRLR